MLENKNIQGDIIAHIILYQVMNDKSLYKKFLLIMQTII